MCSLLSFTSPQAPNSALKNVPKMHTQKVQVKKKQPLLTLARLYPSHKRREICVIVVVVTMMQCSRVDNSDEGQQWEEDVEEECH